METMSQARSCRGHESNAPKRKFCMVLLPNRIANLEIYIGKEGSCPSEVLALTGFAPSPQSMSSSCVLALNRTCIHELAHLGKIWPSNPIAVLFWIYIQGVLIWRGVLPQARNHMQYLWLAVLVTIWLLIKRYFQNGRCESQMDVGQKSQQFSISSCEYDTIVESNVLSDISWYGLSIKRAPLKVETAPSYSIIFA